ncbi:hypothetical protein [Raoultella ornithinolytica]|uniref:hypothetical protein n=1 Tax=Raoultella ornithinolytica TaxID=54291 RepID=UPI001F330549|nr:hypothetical protein [Raoultella ornithinolytica]MCF6686025.1 hypothetical protein [Raoultella ornithinolytica]
MPEYKVAKRSFINGRLHEPGDIVVYDGAAGSNLVSTDASLSDKVDAISVEELTELDELRKQYEEMFGEAPHFNTKAEALKAKIAKRRKELGV